ncbi:MAG: DHH family phosphoesterase [Clostridia bacterium]|nr:DHH family phosphoesterase [Clostridia bacterium]
MADYKALSAKECAERILEIEHPLVLMHVRPDGDTVGSAAALMYIFHKLGKAPLWACSDPIPERLEFLLKTYREAYRYEYDSSTVVTVDIPTKEQIGEIYDFCPRAALMIDHHEVGAPFADNFIIGGASSAGEVVMLVVEELVKMGKIELDLGLAYPLYAAISSDTGCFRYSNATPETLRRGATLIETGIDSADINHRLFNSKTPRQIRAEGFIAERINTEFEDKVAYATVTRRERENLGVLMEHLETAIDVVRSVAFVEISFVIKETDKGEYKASLRSTEHDVAAICARFGGGGHVKAAGCTVPARSIDEAARRVLREIGKAYYTNT